AGTLSIAALAAGKASVGQATVTAFVQTGIYQSADGTNGAHGAVVLTNASTGSLSVLAAAQATAELAAHAVASITGFGIYQTVDEADDASVLLSNSGTLSIATQA